MSSIWRRLSSKRCLHEHTLVVMSVGVRRVVCEQCGHVSFEMEPLLEHGPGEIENTKLAKVAGF